MCSLMACCMFIRSVLVLVDNTSEFLCLCPLFPSTPTSFSPHFPTPASSNLPSPTPPLHPQLHHSTYHILPHTNPQPSSLLPPPILPHLPGHIRTVPNPPTSSPSTRPSTAVATRGQSVSRVLRSRGGVGMGMRWRRLRMSGSRLPFLPVLNVERGRG